MGGKVAERSAGDFAIECESVTIAYRSGSEPVLADVDLRVARGTFLTIVGGSGVGKSTLLRALAGLVPIRSGSIRIDGENVVGPGDGVMLVFQDYSNSLLPWRTVERNAALGLEQQRMTRQEREARISDVLRMVGLLDARHKYPWQLSGGMQQRLQLARALAVRPRLLLMDEPFGSLDAITKATLQDQLQTVHLETGMTIVFITHDVEEAVYLGDRAVVLAGRPARNVLELPIDLPRPRQQLETREGREFLELRHALYGAI